MESTAAHILVVDEDEQIADSLCRYLARFGLQAFAATNGFDMRRELAAQRIDLVVLDLTMLSADGRTLVQALRASSPIPIIMMSGCGQATGRVLGLELGGDDCLSKPFEPRELVARIRTVLRRARASAAVAEPEAVLSHFDGWTLHHMERRLSSPTGVVVPLSNAEYLLLATFLETPQHILSRAHLMAQARGRALGETDRSIDLLVSRLRQKLLDAAGDAGDFIKTVRGAGYVFNVGSSALRH